MNALIIEDEKPAADNLANLLNQIDKEIHILARIETVRETINWFESNVPPDLIFLDVHLADDICFKIFDVVNLQTPIIFTTAYDQYALRAFKLSSIDYLLKPIDKEDLEKSLKKFKHLRQQPLDIEALVSAMGNSEADYQKRFIVTAGERIKSVSINNVAYFFGQDKYVYLITKANERYIVDGTLTQLEELVDPLDFFRINRQFLINFDSISEMFAYSRGRVKIELNPTCKEDTIVSIDRSGSFKKWLNR